MLNRLIAISMIAIGLVACGGSGGDNSPGTANNAPTLGGPLAFSVNAQERLVMNYTLTDPENDPVTVSFTQLPAWVSHRVENQQLIVTVEPDFFDIGDTRLLLTLSDGKAQRQYNIDITVSDNPAQWQMVSKNRENFVGQWDLGGFLQLHLYANQTGFAVDQDGESFHLQWFYREQGYVEISSTQLNCTSDCYDYLELFVIAERDDLQYWGLESDDELLALMAHRYQELPQYEGSYVSSTQSVAQVLSFPTDGKVVEWELPVTIGSAGSNRSWFQRFELEVNDDFSIAVRQHEKSTSQLPFYNLQFYTSDQVTLLSSLEAVTLLPSAENMLVIEFQMKVELAEPSIEPEHYDGLSELLGRGNTHTITLLQASPAEVPAIQFGSPYVSGFRFEQAMPEHNFLFGGNEVIFHSNQQGVAHFYIPGIELTNEVPFSWRTEQGHLFIELAGREYGYYFLRTPTNGVSLVAENGVYYPFVHSETNQTGSLAGSYLVESTNFQFDHSRMYHTFYDDYKAMLFGSYSQGSANYLWRKEDNGSVTTLFATNCALWWMSFTDCESYLKQLQLDGIATWLQYRNYQLIAEDEQSIVVQLNYYHDNLSSKQSYQSIQRWLKVPAAQ